MKISLFIGLSSILTHTSVPVHAADTPQPTATESILLSPTSKRYGLKAGTERSDTFKIINDGQSSFDFVTYSRPYSVTGEEYSADFVSNAKNADAYKWIQFDQPSYQVAPGESVDVKYTIRVPANATPGGHYGVLFAETLPNSQSQGTGVKTKKRVGSILYVTVEGDVTRSGKLLGTDVAFLQFNAPLKASQRIANSGNTDFEVKTIVEVSDVFGGVKHRSERNLAVLPDSIRKIAYDWDSPAWLGLYKVELNTSFLDTKSSTSHYVLIVPIWVYITLGVLILLRVTYAFKRHRKKR